MPKTTKTAGISAKADLLRLLGGLDSPRESVRENAARAIFPRLGELKELVIKGVIKEAQLGKLWRLGFAAMPKVVSMLARIGARCPERSRFLAEALEKMVAPAPDRLKPHQSKLERLIMDIETIAPTIYHDAARSIGVCLGGIGKSVDNFIASKIDTHSKELDRIEKRRNQYPLRLLALVTAARKCGGPKSRAALNRLLTKPWGAGLALEALFELREPQVVKHLASKVVTLHGETELFNVLSKLLSLPQSVAQPFLEKGKSELKKLSRDNHLDWEIRGAAFGLLCRFFYPDALKLAVETSKRPPSSEYEEEFLIVLVRSIFASDGLQEERIVHQGGYPLSESARLELVGEGREEIRVRAQVLLRGGGSKFGKQHVTLARNISSQGPSVAASLLWGILGEGIPLVENSGVVFYRPVSLMDTPDGILTELADLALKFASTQKHEWRNFCHHAGVGKRADEGGAFYAIRYLKRIGDVERLRKLARNRKAPKVQCMVLRLAGNLARELRAEYRTALRAKRLDALFGLVEVAREVPEAATLLRSPAAQKLLFWRTSTSEPGNNAFSLLSGIAPALADDLYQSFFQAESSLKLNPVGKSDDDTVSPLETFWEMHEVIPKD